MSTNISTEKFKMLAPQGPEKETMSSSESEKESAGDTSNVENDNNEERAAKVENDDCQLPSEKQRNSSNNRRGSVRMTLEKAQKAWSDKWSLAMQALTRPLLRMVLAVSNHGARHPKAYFVSIIVLSFGILFLGLATNFELDTSDAGWSPADSRAARHGEWVEEESGFAKAPRYIVLIVHDDGQNVLGDSNAYDGANHVFEAIDTVRNTKGYDELCSNSDLVDPSTNESYTCDISGISNFWNDTTAIFEKEVSSDDDAVVVALSSETFPSGRKVNLPGIVGYAEKNSSGLLTSALSYVTIIGLPSFEEVEDDAMDFEERVIENLDALQESSNSTFRIEYLLERSLEDEFARAVAADLPLLPAVFILMSVLCIIVFSKRDKVMSRSWLGLGAVFTILLAIFTSHGLLFAIGVPYTSLTQILPFIMFGIGLDNAFVIMGAYERTAHKTDVVERIHDTFEDIGGSIVLTTLSSTLAFALGMISSIPNVAYLVAYAFPTILIDFFYQLTFFVALMVVDEKRIQDNRRDCCFCCKAKDNEDDNNDEGVQPNQTKMEDEDDNNDEEIQPNQTERDDEDDNNDKVIQPNQTKRDDEDDNNDEGVLPNQTKRDDEDDDNNDEEIQPAHPPKKHFADHLMSKYADFLMLPAVKVIVMIVFPILLGLGAWSASHLEQGFEFIDLVPSDSYIRTYWDAYTQLYEQNGARPDVYFRNVDFSSTTIQDQMEQYVHELAEFEYSSGPPFFFWLDDFQNFTAENAWLWNVTFNDQVKAFLEDPIYFDVYNNAIVLDDDGTMTASRTTINFDNVDEEDVTTKTDALTGQREISESQPVNKGLDDWAFFTFADEYYTWEFYAVSTDELILSTVIGVAVVSVLAVVFIPHWSAILFVGPMVLILYVDLLGFVQIVGITISPVMYIAMVMSIGLMVDYVMHVTLRFMEIDGSDRVAKAKETLETIGASVMLGGFSTMVGMLPLALSTSEIFWTIFIIFFGLVVLGLLHGLVYLPVLLSLFGPKKGIAKEGDDDDVDTPTTNVRRSTVSRVLGTSLINTGVDDMDDHNGNFRA